MVGEYRQPTAWANDDGAASRMRFATPGRMVDIEGDVSWCYLPCLRLRHLSEQAATPRIDDCFMPARTTSDALIRRAAAPSD